MGEGSVETPLFVYYEVVFFFSYLILNFFNFNFFKRENARYEFAHEILKNDDSVFGVEKVHKKRRISVICRNESIDEMN